MISNGVYPGWHCFDSTCYSLFRWDVDRISPLFFHLHQRKTVRAKALNSGNRKIYLLKIKHRPLFRVPCSIYHYFTSPENRYVFLHFKDIAHRMLSIRHHGLNYRNVFDRYHLTLGCYSGDFVEQHGSQNACFLENRKPRKCEPLESCISGRRENSYWIIIRSC